MTHLAAVPAPAAAILAVASDRTWGHVYPSIEQLLHDDDIGAGVGERTGALEFFDVAGRRLAPVFDNRWHLLRLLPTGDAADPDDVVGRIEAVVAHMRAAIRTRPAEVELYGLTVAEAEELLPDVAGVSLEKAFDLFSGDPTNGDVGATALGDDDSRGFTHNWKHRVGWHH